MTAQLTINQRLVSLLLVFTALLPTVGDPLLPGSRPCRLPFFWLLSDCAIMAASPRYNLSVDCMENAASPLHCCVGTAVTKQWPFFWLHSSCFERICHNIYFKIGISNIYLGARTWYSQFFPLSCYNLRHTRHCAVCKEDRVCKDCMQTLLWAMFQSSLKIPRITR
jgi:hypothetical protein